MVGVNGIKNRVLLLKGLDVSLLDVEKGNFC